MKTETSFFVQVLADYLNGRSTKVSENMDWDVLATFCQNQQLTGVFYHQCKNSITQSDLPMAIKNKWRVSYAYNVFQYSKRLALLKQVDTAFQKEGIPYVIFKGIEVAEFYPTPAQRTMGDSDLLVHEEDKQRACETLIRLGFDVDTSSPIEWYALKDGMLIELHHRLIYAHTIELEGIQTWGDKVWEYTKWQNDTVHGKLDLTYHMVYVLLHLRKHMIEEGVGFRQFMDAVVLASQPGINWKQAELWFKELHLVKFSQVCFAFCQRWFDVQIPIGKLELTEEFYNDATERILTGGVFGAHDNDYKENAVFNEVYFSRTSRTKGFLRWAFLPYNEMRGRFYCKFLDGRPYLLPVAWCWRLMYRIYTGNLVPLLKGAFGDETIKKKEDRLSKWGL